MTIQQSVSFCCYHRVTTAFEKNVLDFYENISSAAVQPCTQVTTAVNQYSKYFCSDSSFFLPKSSA